MKKRRPSSTMLMKHVWQKKSKWKACLWHHVSLFVVNWKSVQCAQKCTEPKLMQGYAILNVCTFTILRHIWMVKGVLQLILLHLYFIPRILLLCIETVHAQHWPQSCKWPNTDFISAICLMLGSYYCLNIHYPLELGSTLEFLQR